MSRRRLMVALHDVAPPFEAEIDAQLADLRRLGIGRPVLKVVPNWDRCHPISASGPFLELLQRAEKAGAEIVLHGYSHRQGGPLLGPVLRRCQASLFAGGVAEFQAMTYDEAFEALSRGTAEMEKSGLSLDQPPAFCAPGWLITSEAKRAVRDAGLRYLIGMFSILDLQTEQRTWLPSFGYMGVSPAFEALVRIFNGIVASRPLIERADLVKVYLHPGQAGTRAAYRRTLDRIGRMLDEGWDPATFREVAAVA